MLASLYIAEILKKTWFASVKSGKEMLLECIQKLKRNIGVSPIYKTAYTSQEVMGTKCKPVAKKVILVLTQDPGAGIPCYKEISIGELPELLVVPTKMEDQVYTKGLLKERVMSIISRVPARFLMKEELELFVHIMLKYDKAIAFADLEGGTFSQKY